MVRLAAIVVVSALLPACFRRPAPPPAGAELFEGYANALAAGETDCAVLSRRLANAARGFRARTGRWPADGKDLAGEASFDERPYLKLTLNAAEGGTLHAQYEAAAEDPIHPVGAHRVTCEATIGMDSSTSGRRR